MTSATFSAPTVLNDFISDQELETCIKIYDSLPAFEQATTSLNTNKDYLFYNSQDRTIHDIFWEKFCKIWPDRQIIVDGGCFTEWNGPNKIHTDSFQLEWKQPEGELGYAILVPLKTDTGEGTPKTVFFDQWADCPQIRHGNIRNINKNTGEIPGYGQVNNYTKQSFDRLQPYGDLLAHCDDDLLHGFSVKTALNWEFGSAMIWHRSQFHCSSAFEDDYNKKLHLVFFINFKNME